MWNLYSIYSVLMEKYVPLEFDIFSFKDSFPIPVAENPGVSVAFSASKVTVRVKWCVITSECDSKFRETGGQEDRREMLLIDKKGKVAS